MNRSRKIHPLSCQEALKNSNTNSDLESLLVSSVRCDTTDDRPTRIHGSIIRRNVQSNVVIEEGFQCGCEEKIEAMGNTIRILSLTMHELESKINICFTKQASMQSELADHACKLEEKGLNLWELGQKQKGDAEMIARVREESKTRLRELEEELKNVRRVLNRFDVKDNERCPSSKLVEFKLQKLRGDQDSKFAKLFETIQQIGTLQRKMIAEAPTIKQQTYPDQDSIMPYSVGHHRPMKIIKGCSVGKNRTCQSTNISYSRNMDFRS